MLIFSSFIRNTFGRYLLIRNKATMNFICDKDNCKICNLKENLSPNWHNELKDEFTRPYFLRIIKNLHSSETIYPELTNVFSFSKYVKVDEVKVVILGQDPYHGKGQAMGLAFSVPKDILVPPSLKNIYKEIKRNYPDYEIPKNGDLTNWAKQGVLLLNAVLTVIADKPSSHADIGWHSFTDKIIEILNKKNGLVFIFWGKHAQKKQHFIDKKRHLVLTAAHPSPFSARRGFDGCEHFLKANQYLMLNNKKPIKW